MFAKLKQMCAMPKMGNRGLSAEKAVEVFIALFLVGVLVVKGITKVETADTSGWSADTVDVFSIIGVLAAIGVALIVFRMAKGK